MPNYYIGVWEEPDLSEDEETRRWEQLLLAFQMKQSSSYDQLKSAVLLSKPFSTNLEWGLIEEVRNQWNRSAFAKTYRNSRSFFLPWKRYQA